MQENTPSHSTIEESTDFLSCNKEKHFPNASLTTPLKMQGKRQSFNFIQLL